MSNKGSKDFRLWLPLLPWIAAVAAYGWTWMPLRRAGARLGFDLAFAAGVVVLGCTTLAPLGSQRFAGYWRAMDWVDGRAREIALARASTAIPARVRVASAYNWAVYLRDSPEIDLVKLPWQLDRWPDYTPEQREEDLRALGAIDLFLVHTPVLRANPELLDFLAARFAVVAAVYDQTTDLSRIGPILVLERRAPGPGDNGLYGFGPAGISRLSSPPSAPVHFVGGGADGRAESLELEGWSYARLPPQGLGWITYNWRTPTGITRDYTILDRLTFPGESGAWQNNHLPAWGQRRTDTWKPGERLSEGYLVIPATDPYRAGAAYQPLGLARAENGEASAELWLSIVDLEPEALAHGLEVVRARMSPARIGEDLALVPSGGPDPLETSDGIRFSADGFVRIASFRLPLPSEKDRLR